MSNIDFLIADVTQLFSNAKITFSQGGATNCQKKDLAPGLMTVLETTQLGVSKAKELLCPLHRYKQSSYTNLMYIATVTPSYVSVNSN